MAWFWGWVLVGRVHGQGASIGGWIGTKDVSKQAVHLFFLSPHSYLRMTGPSELSSSFLIYPISLTYLSAPCILFQIRKGLHVGRHDKRWAGTARKWSVGLLLGLIAGRNGSRG
jgi:hypothetical protein